MYKHMNDNLIIYSHLVFKKGDAASYKNHLDSFYKLQNFTTNQRVVWMTDHVQTHEWQSDYLQSLT